jgi:hypothetical protein
MSSPRRPFDNLHREEWLRLADAAAIVVLAICATYTMAAAAAYQGGDFRAFYAAGKVALDGGNPYDYARVSRVLWSLAGDPGATGPYLPPYYYYYPPWLCLLLAPIAALPFAAARLVWLALNALLLAVVTGLIVAAAGWRPRPWQWGLAGIGILYPLGWVALSAEQLGIFTLFWLAVATALLSPIATSVRPPARSVLIGLSLCLAITKPQDGFLPVAVLLIVAWRQHSRAAIAWFAACLAGLLIVSSLLLPNWWSALDVGSLAANLTAQLQTSGAPAQRVNATLLDWLGSLGIGGWATAPVYLALAGACCLSLWRAIAAKLPVVYMLALAGVASFLLTPYAFEYDYVVMTPALLWCLHGLQRADLVRRAMLIPVLAGLFTVHLWGHWMSDAYWAPIFMAAALAVEPAGGGHPSRIAAPAEEE